MKKIILLIAIFIVSLFSAGCESNESVEITKYSWGESSFLSLFGSRKTGFLIENKNDISTDVSITLKYYNKDKIYLDEETITVNAIPQKNKYFLVKRLESDVDKVEFKFTSNESKYKGLVPEIVSLYDDRPISEKDILVKEGYDKLGRDEKYFIQVTNNTKKKPQKCKCTVVFYKDNGEIAGAETLTFDEWWHNGDSKEGKMEVNVPMITKYKKRAIFVNAYIEK